MNEFDAMKPGEVMTVIQVPNGSPTPEGWRESGNRPSHHSLWSRIVVLDVTQAREQDEAEA